LGTFHIPDSVSLIFFTCLQGVLIFSVFFAIVSGAAPGLFFHREITLFSLESRRPARGLRSAADILYMRYRGPVVDWVVAQPQIRQIRQLCQGSYVADLIVIQPQDHQIRQSLQWAYVADLIVIQPQELQIRQSRQGS
jgi:hypothetical protein